MSPPSDTNDAYMRQDDLIPPDQTQMATVVVLNIDRRARAHITTAIRPFGEARFCDRPPAMWQAMAGGDVLAVVTSPVDADGRPTASAIDELRRIFPSLPVIVYAPRDDQEQNEELTALAFTPGVTIAVDRDTATLMSVVRARFATARVQSAARELLDAVDSVQPPLPALVTIYLRALARRPRWGLRVGTVMASIDPTKRRTLEALLRAANLPTAEQCIGWVFALHGTWLWALPGLTFETVASRLGFREPSVLRSVFKHRIGMAPRTVMRAGGFPYLRGRFVALLQGEWADAPRGRRWATRLDQQEQTEAEPSPVTGASRPAQNP